jgi:hypothetical protein
MQYPITSFNSKHEEQTVKAQTELLFFALTDSRRIEITTEDKQVAGYLGIGCKNLGYFSAEEELKDMVNTEGQSE